MKAASQTKTETHDPDWYLRDPRTRKWLVQCIACQRVGYRADAPPHFFDRDRIVAHLHPLTLDSAGLCDECQHAQTLSNDTNNK